MISNHAVLIGRLTRDVEVRKTQSDKSVASFTIAVNKPYNKEHDHPEADFFGCVAWEGRADFISKYFKKGDKIAVAGRLQTREWEKDGAKQRVVELLVEDVEFVEKRGDSAPKAESSAPAKATAKPVAKTRAQEIEEMEDALPF
jgi:single-strand DNA-binding protein